MVKNPTMKSILVLTLVFLFSSCMSSFNGVLNPTSELKNVKYVNTAFGFSKATYVLGLGGNNHDALVLEAKLNMMKNFPLENNQFYANYAVDFKKKNNLIVQETLVTVSADVVQEKANLSDENYSTLLKSKLGIVDDNAYFSIGDTVVDSAMTYYTIEFNKGGNLIVNPLNIIEKRYSQLIKNHNELYSTNFDDIVKLFPNKTISLEDRNYFILGINSKALLLQDADWGGVQTFMLMDL